MLRNDNVRYNQLLLESAQLCGRLEAPRGTFNKRLKISLPTENHQTTVSIWRWMELWEANVVAPSATFLLTDPSSFSPYISSKFGITLASSVVLPSPLRSPRGRDTESR